MNEENQVSNVRRRPILWSKGVTAGAIASFITAAMIIVAAPNIVYAQI